MPDGEPSAQTVRKSGPCLRKSNASRARARAQVITPASLRSRGPWGPLPRAVRGPAPSGCRRRPTGSAHVRLPWRWGVCCSGEARNHHGKVVGRARQKRAVLTTPLLTALLKTHTVAIRSTLRDQTPRRGPPVPCFWHCPHHLVHVLPKFTRIRQRRGMLDIETSLLGGFWQRLFLMRGLRTSRSLWPSAAREEGPVPNRLSFRDEGRQTRAKQGGRNIDDEALWPTLRDSPWNGRRRSTVLRGCTSGQERSVGWDRRMPPERARSIAARGRRQNCAHAPPATWRECTSAATD